MNNDHHDQALRQHLLALLEGKQAHMTFDAAVANFPMDEINTRPPNMMYTPWHLIEHMRITQQDILDYIRNPDYVTPDWPDEYWPSSEAMADEVAWQRTLNQFRADLRAVEDIVRDPATDLLAQIAHGEPGHTILREVLLVADHNAYHIGELGALRQVMGAWATA